MEAEVEGHSTHEENFAVSWHVEYLNHPSDREQVVKQVQTAAGSIGLHIDGDNMLKFLDAGRNRQENKAREVVSLLRGQGANVVFALEESENGTCIGLNIAHPRSPNSSLVLKVSTPGAPGTAPSDGQLQYYIEEKK